MIQYTVSATAHARTDFLKLETYEWRLGKGGDRSRRRGGVAVT
jgi:hypothetical protein